MRIKMILTLFILFCACKDPSNPPNIGNYDYDPSEWSWYAEDSNRYLKHNTIDSCFVSTGIEPIGYEEDNWEIKTTHKIIGKTRYNVIRVYYNGEFWCLSYINQDNFDKLDVYMSEDCIECQKAAEKIIKRKNVGQ